jgi:hypothetical protein
MLNSRGKTAFGGHYPIEIIFNYAGLFQQFQNTHALFSLVDRLDVQDSGDDISRLSMFEISASVTSGRLHFSINFNRHMKHQEKIFEWSDNCELALYTAARQLPYMKPSHTLCDFPLLPMSYGSLEQFTRTLHQIGVDSGDLEGAYPCAPIQQGILLSQDRDPLSYQTCTTWIVKSPEGSQPIDIGMLKDAWQMVVDRHPILRTRIVQSVCRDGYFDQVVLKMMPANIQIVSCNSMPSEFISNHRVSFARQAKPLHHLTLCSAPAGDVFCRLEISHAILDALSVQVLKKDLQLAYANQLPRTKGPSYSAYVSYINSLPKDSVAKYWRNYLQGVEPCLFPSMYEGQTSTREHTKTLRSTNFTLSGGPQLSQWCSDHEVTRANVFQLAWGLVLRAFCGSTQICFGYLTNGRDVPLDDLKDAVGPYINMLVCQMKLADDVQVVDTVRKTQAEYLESLSHQHCSLGEIIRSLKLPSRRLFNSVMSVQSAPIKILKDPVITLEEVDATDPTEVCIIRFRALLSEAIVRPTIAD